MTKIDLAQKLEALAEMNKTAPEDYYGGQFWDYDDLKLMKDAAAALRAVEPPAKCTCKPFAQQLGVPFGLTAVAVDHECPVHREPKTPLCPNCKQPWEGTRAGDLAICSRCGTGFHLNQPSEPAAPQCTCGPRFGFNDPHAPNCALNRPSEPTCSYCGNMGSAGIRGEGRPVSDLRRAVNRRGE